MIKSIFKIVLALQLSSALYAEMPDISNLNNCIEDVRQSALTNPDVLTFDAYKNNYNQLIKDLQSSIPFLPFVYQEAAVKPLIRYLENLGEFRYRQVFRYSVYENLQQLISDASLSILYHQKSHTQIVAFQEVISDLYVGFINEEKRCGKETGVPINPPTYGIIPPLVKFGNADFGPYTWPSDVTYRILGMGCAIVSLPPAQLEGGLIAWTTLGHETGGHNITHADEGLLKELQNKIYEAIIKKFNSEDLANYWGNCVDESVADVCGYLNMGPSAGIGLIGYFRALGNGKLSTIGYSEGPHPIDLLRGYLAASVTKRLHFENSDLWSKAITAETRKDDATLTLIDAYGNRYPFPVSLEIAISSTEVVAQTILRAILTSLENHSLQGIQDWLDKDQRIVNKLISAFKKNEELPQILKGSGFFAAHAVAAATQAALEDGAPIDEIFREMQNFLAAMHFDNPIWSTTPTPESLELLEMRFKELEVDNSAAGLSVIMRSNHTIRKNN
jgi:hypothetical protein